MSDVKKKIVFMPMSKDIGSKLNPPTPSKNFLPKWYRDAQPFIGGKLDIGERGINKDLKLCIPFLDAMTAGYSVELPCDIHISHTDGGTNFYWHEEPFPMDERPPGIASALPVPSGHNPTLYAWKVHWASITPPGYSALFCHPLNRTDLPFYTTAGIVDTDGFSAGGDVPFYLRQNFSGVIPAGTPIVQIIPFRREPWSSSIKDHSEGFIARMQYAVSRVLFGGYAKTFWKKKHWD